MAMPFNSPLMIDQELWSVGHVLETQHTSFSRYKLKVTFQWLEIEASHLKTNLSGSFSLGLGQRSRIWAHNWRQAAWLGNAHGSHKHCLWNWGGIQLQRRLLGCGRSFWWGQTEQDKGKSLSFVLTKLIKGINLFRGLDKLFAILWKNPASFRTVMRGLSLQCLMCRIFWGNLEWLDLTSNTVDLSQHPVGNSFWIY